VGRRPLGRPAPQAAADTSEAAIRAGEAALARQFAGVTAWFGRATMEWWAQPSLGGLVSAPSAQELAALLRRLGARQAGLPTAARHSQATGVQGRTRREQELAGPAMLSPAS
jgi:hypothetical protein